MLTYETLRKIEHEERMNKKLSKLPDGFMKEALEYLKKKEKMTGMDRHEFETSKDRLQNILKWRERKIVNFSLDFIRSGIIPGNMTPEERELFDGFVKRVQEFRKRQKEAMSGKRIDFKTVAFVQAAPQFVGTDMGYYGPYQQGDMATVPSENANILIEKGMGELVEEG